MQKCKMLKIQKFHNSRANNVVILGDLEWSLCHFKHTCNNLNDINTAWNTFKGIITTCITNLVPLKSCRAVPCKPWINHVITCLKCRIATARSKGKCFTTFPGSHGHQLMGMAPPRVLKLPLALPEEWCHSYHVFILYPQFLQARR